MLNVTVLLVDYVTTLMITPNLRNFSLILQSRNVCMKSVGTKVDFWERMHFRKFENVMVIFCKKKVTVVVGNITFCKGWMSLWYGLDSESTFHTSLQLSSGANLNSFCTKYRSYLSKLIYICGHFLTVNNRPYGRRYVENLYHCVLSLNFTLI